MRRFPALAVLLAAGACRSAPETPPPAPEAAGPQLAGEEILVCSERVAIGAPVVPWFEEPFYSAYATEPRFAADGPTGLRYQPGRSVEGALARRVSRDGWDRASLTEAVDLLVLHYDACGTSRECFRVLQDRRGLSVHFLLDVDGTLYQTLDAKEQAWHARQANPRSIGIEIAHVGAFPPDAPGPLAEWYVEDAGGLRLAVPARLEGGGVRTAGFVGRPARPVAVRGAVHGVLYEQPDFTPEQYETLARLAAALTRTLPRIELEAPRDASGRVRTDALSDAELRAFHGVIGHQHVSGDKRDPGPAFDWERFLRRARELAGGYSP